MKAKVARHPSSERGKIVQRLCVAMNQQLKLHGWRMELEELRNHWLIRQISDNVAFINLAIEKLFFDGYIDCVQEMAFIELIKEYDEHLADAQN